MLLTNGAVRREKLTFELRLGQLSKTVRLTDSCILITKILLAFPTIRTNGLFNKM
jgi:hypothetical protein